MFDDFLCERQSDELISQEEIDEYFAFMQYRKRVKRETMETNFMYDVDFCDCEKVSIPEYDW
jgi:hypothetical protein